MPLPKPIAVQTIAGLTQDPHNYESHKRTIEAVNQLIANLGPGGSVTPSDFVLSPGLGTGAKITTVSGTFKRGAFVLQLGSASLTANPTITLNFPRGLFTTPFAVLTRNGGTGALGFSWTQSATSIIITLAGTGTGSQTYGFQYQVTN